MRIAVVDPSDFTPPYDRRLAQALGRHSATESTCLVGAGRGEGSDSHTYVPHFYCLTERIRGRGVPKPFYLGLKGIEHVIDLLRLWRRLANWQPDIIHFQWLPIPGLDRWIIPLFERIAPVVLTVHDTEPFNDDPPSKLQKVGWEGALRALRTLIVHTQFSARRLRKMGIDTERIHVVPHGLLDDNSDGVPVSRGDEAREVEQTVIQFFGTLKPYKGVDVLLRAFAQLRTDEPAVLRISGRPRMDVDPLRNLARQLGVADRVEWDLRFVPDDEVPVLFREADVLALPYRTIDASGVLTKALLFGRPVVATDIGGIAEFVDDGEEGRLVPPNDPAATANALQQLLDDPSLRIQMGKKARQRAEAIPSWDDIADQTIKVYRQTRNENRLCDVEISTSSPEGKSGSCIQPDPRTVETT